MISIVLHRLETLQADLAAVDATSSDAVDRVADAALALRDLLAGVGASAGAGEGLDAALRAGAAG